ncbi:MAG: PASTA domain containing protein [Candidatus Moranbacteria bacterium GW2011_GWA2_39_41]|nr:MAG: PASTA domain containing protein [Candidatus Moranbacteria bacterium GW2011_GWA2_39_41]
MNPYSHIHFKGQKDDETIILVIRRHWFNILQQLFLVFLMIGFLFGSLTYLPILFPVLNTSSAHDLFIFLANSFAIVTWIILFLVWIDYYFDVWIITSRRIVNIDQKGLFIRTISELEFDKIQDVTTEVKGIIPTFLNFGNVFVQTAGEKERFIFQQIPDPYAVKDLIMNLEEKGEKAEATQRAREEARELRSALQDKNFH